MDNGVCGGTCILLKFLHLTFLVFAFMVNTIVTSMLLLGGAATVESLTNMDYRLISFLIPWCVLLYTAVGGLKASFIASYIHTVIIFAVLITMIYDYLDATVSFTEAECAAIYSDSSGVSFYDASK